MIYLKYLVFHSKSLGADSECLWLSRNIDFIYSCVLSHRKTESSGIGKINVYLEDSGEPWNGIIEGGISETKEQFRCNIIELDSEAFEIALNESASNSLSKIAGAGYMDKSEVDGVVAQVISTGFVYEHLIKSMRRKSDRKMFYLSIESRFGSSFLTLVDKKMDKRYRLFKFWPSPWIVLLKFSSAEFMDDGRLAVCLRWQEKDERLRWGMPVFDTASDIQVQEVRFGEESKKRFFIFDPV